MHFVQFITSFSALSQYFWRTVGKCTIRILFLLSCIPPCPRSRHFEKVSFKRIINNSSTIRSPLYILIDQLSALPIDQETLINQCNLWASSPGHFGSRARKGKRACMQLRLWNLYSTSNSPVAPLRPSCQISANQRIAEMSVNVHKH